MAGQDSAGERSQNLASEVLQSWRTDDFCISDAVDVNRADWTARVDECVQRDCWSLTRIHSNNAYLHDPIGAAAQSSRFEVQDGIRSLVQSPVENAHNASMPAIRGVRLQHLVHVGLTRGRVRESTGCMRRNTIVRWFVVAALLPAACARPRAPSESATVLSTPAVDEVTFEAVEGPVFERLKVWAREASRTLLAHPGVERADVGRTTRFRWFLRGSRRRPRSISGA